MHAASIDFGNTEMVSLLLKSGAKPQVLSKANQTARQIAEKYNHSAIAKALGGSY